MFNPKRTDPKPNRLETAIDKMLVQTYDMCADSEEMTSAVANIKTLIEAKAAAESSNRPAISTDALTTVVGNLVGIAMIITHERAHVITTKALGFVIKPKA